MRLIILDYKGTLDTHADPKGLVQALVKQGDCVVLWSGTSSRDMIPGLEEAFTYVFSKGSSLSEVKESVEDQGIVVDKVYLSDDDIDLDYVKWKGFIYVAPKNLDSLRR